MVISFFEDMVGSARAIRCKRQTWVLVSLVDVLWRSCWIVKLAGSLPIRCNKDKDTGGVTAIVDNAGSP